MSDRDPLLDAKPLPKNGGAEAEFDRLDTATGFAEKGQREQTLLERIRHKTGEVSTTFSAAKENKEARDESAMAKAVSQPEGDEAQNGGAVAEQASGESSARPPVVARSMMVISDSAKDPADSAKILLQPSLVGEALAGVYLLEEEIAEGSTSIIYRATNRRLDQPVAVKVLYGSYTKDETLMARFETEARVQARLSHPHIVKVFDFISLGHYAIVMELVEGTPLDKLLYGGPLSLSRVKRLMIPVIDAIGYAHSRGVVHRDIKPSNIIVSNIGDGEFPRVMDFGIAKVVEKGPSQTEPGAMLGTLLFMSPEQCKATTMVDARSDIYSIGVTLYQMLTAMVPFFAESAFEIMLAHVQTPPTPPREFAPDLPDEWQAVVLKCLQKKNRPIAFKRPKSCSRRSKSSRLGTAQNWRSKAPTPLAIFSEQRATYR
jgi:serine/threonine protein kinase